MPRGTVGVYVMLSAGLLGSGAAVVALVLATPMSMLGGMVLLAGLDVAVVVAAYLAVRRTMSGPG